MNNYITKTEQKQVNSKQIFSESKYQRAIDHNRVKKIVTDFNPNLVNPIKISLRDGKYYVFDGQHTLAALKMKNNNNDLMVECKIYFDLTLEDEAKLFSQQNGYSRGVVANGKFKALYAAKDIDIVEMHDTVEKLGIKFDFSNAKGNNKIIACSTVYKIFKKTTKSEFAEMLSIIKEAWNGIAESFNKEILSGMFVFYTTYKDVLNKTKAVNQFSKITPNEIVRNGKQFTTGGDNRFAVQLLNAYNKNLRSGRLDETKIIK